MPKDSARLRAGSIVRIPFGKRRVVGIILDLYSRVPTFPVKLLTPTNVTLTPHQIKFARWIAETMHGGLGYTLRLFLPPLVKTNFDFKKKQYAQKLILVPERTFLRNRGTQTIFHATLPAREIARIWHSVARGHIRSVVGTQKALFLPFQNLQSIVVEEAQLPTHKLWDQYPRLDTRDGACELAAIHRAKLVFSASFPSAALHLKPEVHTFTGSDYKHKNSLPLSLIPRLREWAHAKQKILLLYNRTGETVKKLKYSLHRTLGKDYQHLTVATSSIFAENPKSFKHIVWLAPELTFSFPDFRSVEEGLVMLTRLQQLLPPRERVVIATRDYALGDQLRHLNISKALQNIKAERERLFLPPFSTAVKLSAKDPVKIRQILRKRFVGTPNQVRGPFNKNDLLLLGHLPELTTAYSDLPLDRVDLSPKDILN